MFTSGCSGENKPGFKSINTNLEIAVLCYLACPLEEAEYFQTEQDQMVPPQNIQKDHLLSMSARPLDKFYFYIKVNADWMSSRWLNVVFLWKCFINDQLIDKTVWMKIRFYKVKILNPCWGFSDGVDLTIDGAKSGVIVELNLFSLRLGPRFAVKEESYPSTPNMQSALHMNGFWIKAFVYEMTLSRNRP